MFKVIALTSFILASSCVSMKSLNPDEARVEITKAEPSATCKLISEADSLDGGNFFGCSDNYACLKRAANKVGGNLVVIDVATAESLKGRAYKCTIAPVPNTKSK